MSADDSTHKERRAFIRISKSLKLYYKVIQETITSSKNRHAPEVFSSTRDVGAGGLLFLTNERLMFGSVLEVRLMLPSAEKLEPIVCSAEVLRCNIFESPSLYETAICFLDISNHDRLILSEFVVAHAQL